MTIEVPGAEVDEALNAESHESDIDLSAEAFSLPTETEVKLKSLVSALNIQLKAAQASRDFFMQSYADELDAQIARAINGGQVSPLSDPEFAAAEAERQEKIRGLESDIEGFQEFIRTLTGENDELSGEVRRLTAEVENGKGILSSLKTQFRTLLEELKSEHEGEVGRLNETISQNADNAERERIQTQEAHEREVARLNAEAEAERQEAERRRSKLIEDFRIATEQKQQEHEDEIATLNREAQEREDALREEYRLLENSIPGKLKVARAGGRAEGLNLSRMVVESANEMGLDKLSSPALSSIINP